MQCNIPHVHVQLDDVGVLPGQVADEAFVLKVWPAHCFHGKKEGAHIVDDTNHSRVGASS
jgi:hypothetical protein